METVTEGNVTVDSNTGTADDLQREMQVEVVKPKRDARAGAVSVPAADVKTAQVLDDDGDADGNVADASAAGKALAKKKGSYQARIDDLTAAHYTTKGQLDAANAEIARLRALSEGKPAKEEAEAKPGKAKPAAAVPTLHGVPLDAEKFPRYADYLTTHPEAEQEDWYDARDEWKEAKGKLASDAAAAAKHESAADTAHKAAFAKTADDFAKRMKPRLEKDPDFYDRIDPRLTETPAASALKPGQKVTIGSFIVQQVITSQVSDLLMERLSADKSKELQRLATLKPEAIIRAIAKMEIELGATDDDSGPSEEESDDDAEDGEEREERTDLPARRGSSRGKSDAEPPIKPVRGSSNQPPEREASDADDDDTWYRKEKAAAARKRRQASA